MPLLEWLDELPEDAQDKCLTRMARLGNLGNDLRRPEADYLRDGIYELRASYRGLHHRLLYFFSGQNVVVLSHGVTKERVVPPKDIDLAAKRMKQVKADFDRFAVETRGML